MQNYVDGGEAVVQGFRSLGVDYVMASPGSEWGAVWEALARQKVTNTPGPVRRSFRLCIALVPAHCLCIQVLRF